MIFRKKCITRGFRVFLVRLCEKFALCTKSSPFPPLPPPDCIPPSAFYSSFARSPRPVNITLVYSAEFAFSFAVKASRSRSFPRENFEHRFKGRESRDTASRGRNTPHKAGAAFMPGVNNSRDSSSAYTGALLVKSKDRDFLVVP